MSRSEPDFQSQEGRDSGLQSSLVPWEDGRLGSQDPILGHRTLASCLPALGQGQGADCHELGQDAVSPEKPVEAAMGRG